MCLLDVLKSQQNLKMFLVQSIKPFQRATLSRSVKKHLCCGTFTNILGIFQVMTGKILVQVFNCHLAFLRKLIQ